MRAAARIHPAVLQVEVHPFFAQQRLAAFCASRDIVVTAYFPGQRERRDGSRVPTHPALAKIGESYDKTAAQVAIRSLVQRGIVAIPKSVKEARIAQNIGVLDRELSAEHMAEVLALDSNVRVGWGGPLVDRGGDRVPRDAGHPYYPFRMVDGTNDATFF